MKDEGRRMKDETEGEAREKRTAARGGRGLRESKWGGGVYQAKWAKALFASAMRWVFSRVVMALPSFL